MAAPGGGSGGAPSAIPGYGSGETPFQAQAGQETLDHPPSSVPGSGGGPLGWAQGTSGSTGPPEAAVQGVQARSQGISGFREARTAGGQESQGGALTGARSGLAQPPSGGEALPASSQGQHRGPPARSQPYGPGTQAGRYPCGPAQTAEPLPAAPGATDPEPKTPASPRTRKAGDGNGAAPENPPAAADDPLYPFLFLPFLGFRRISGKNVLEHDTRSRVYQAIVDHPGIDALTLSDLVETNINTLRYHLFTLIRAGKITAFSRPGVVRYYQNQGMYPPHVQCLLHYLWTGTPREIISLLWHTPGMTRAQVAEALSFSGPSITRHLQNLDEDGIVENRGSGRSHHYYLTMEAIRVLESFGRVMPYSLPDGVRDAAPQSTA